MNVFILIRKKANIIDDIHNVCFKSLHIAQRYVNQMKPEVREGVYIVSLSVDKTNEPVVHEPIILP